MKTTALSLCLISALNPQSRPAPRAVAPAPQLKVVTFDDVYDPEKKVEWSGSPASVTWIGDRHYLVTRTDARKKSSQLLKVETQSGTSEPLFDAARMEQALSGLEGISTLEAAATARLASYTMNQDATTLLLNLSGDLYSYDVAAANATRLTRAEGNEEQGTFSPDGKRVAFVRGGNLVALDLATRAEKALTTDGSSDVLNGKLDWVYQEEIYGRGNFRGYWWSPDSTRIAFLRLDEKRVPRYTLVDDIPYRPEVERYPYPKAGDPNPEVKLGIADVASGKVTWVDPGPSATSDPLIVEVAWHPDGRQVVYQVQDREQTWLDLDLAEADTGRTRRLLRSATSAWIQPHGSPRWLKDGGFLLVSEHSGFAHLYRYAGDGTLLYQVTRGSWDVRRLHGVDEKAGWVYVVASPENATQRYLYRAPLTGQTDPERVTPPQFGGSNAYTISPNGRYAFHRFSSFDDPGVRALVSLPDHKTIATIDDNAGLKRKVAPIVAPPVEFFRTDAGGGVMVDGYALKPPDFDPSRRYPVLVYIYGEPAGQTVEDRWGGSTTLYHRFLASRGYLVVSFDNSGTPAPRGRAWRKAIYGSVGVLSSSQQAAALRSFAAARPYVDLDRVAVWGWSGGGTNTLNLMFRSPELYKVGMAVAPVPDQRLYDTIYQERYMGVPADNADGYRQASAINFAEALKGDLLIVHGSGDDNVHYQGTELLVNRLIELGKPFDFMTYPDRTHAIAEGPGTTPHLYHLLTRYLTTHLAAGPR